MPPQLPEHVLVTLLRQCFITPSCQGSRIRREFRLSSSIRSPRPRHRRPSHPPAIPGCFYSKAVVAETKRFYSQTNFARSYPSELHDYPSTVLVSHDNNGRGRGHQGERYAIIGGGITGLSAAHYLSRELPNAKITVYESSERLGGWLHSRRVNVETGDIVLEQGPRTLRPNSVAGLASLEMIQHLGLKGELLIFNHHSVSDANRYVYYPDHLVRMPGPGQDMSSVLWNVLTEPVFKGVIPGLLFEVVRDPRPENLEDESVASFLERRLGSPDIGNNMVSAVLHGIYAGDINQLSARSLMPKQWHQERTAGSLAQAFINTMKAGGMEMMALKDANLRKELQDKLDPSVRQAMATASVYTFKNGIGALADALENSLRANPNIEFKLQEKITSIEYDVGKDCIKIKTVLNQPPATFRKAISTIFGRHLSSLVSGALPSLSQMHAVTVMVVNLYFSDPNILPERGFGYLIPRSIPYEQNPECALGVVFDSDAVTGQDTATGTKVTVMLGGHWWDGFDAYPDEEEGAAMAKALLKRHLKIDEEPEMVNVGLHRECIPQYTVGHSSRLGAAHSELMDAFKGKLAVAGNSYGGVGLNDCVRSARDVVMAMKFGMRTTGLERVNEDIWVTVKRASVAQTKAQVQREIDRRKNGKHGS